MSSRAEPGVRRRLQFCLICCLLTLGALHAGGSSLCASRIPCKRLAAPGLWDFEVDSPTWQTVDECCHLEDLIGVAMSFPEEHEKRDPRHGILMLGDSVESYTLRAMCTGEDVQLSDHNHSLVGFWACKRGPYLVSLQSMAGVHPEGPWLANVTGSPDQRLMHGLQLYTQVTGHRPTAVVYSSFLWDVARLYHFSPEKQAGIALPKELVSEWGNHLRILLRTAKMHTPPPDTMHIYKTTIMPVEECRNPVGQLTSFIFGKRAHIAALNAVGRQIAQEEGWCVLDMNAMTAQLPTPIKFREDGYHPADAVNLAALNVVLNEVAQRERS